MEPELPKWDEESRWVSAPVKAGGTLTPERDEMGHTDRPAQTTLQISCSFMVRLSIVRRPTGVPSRATFVRCSLPRAFSEPLAENAALILGLQTPFT